MSEPGVIRLTQRIAFPPAAVWTALTDPAVLEKWWARGDVRPEVGHEFSLDMGAFGMQQCVVLAVEPECLFSYSFGAGGLGTTITWTLEPEAGGTLLTLEHSGFDLDTPMGQAAFGGMRAGWPTILPRIEPAIAETSGA